MPEFASFGELMAAIEAGEVTINDIVLVAGQSMMWLCDNENDEHVVMEI